MTRLELLQKTEALLHEKGWVQEVYAKEGYCLLGALGFNLGFTLLPYEDSIEETERWKLYLETAKYLTNCLYPETYKMLKQEIGYQWCLSNTYLLSSWNDKPGRTKEEVFELLDKAINLCE